MSTTPAQAGQPGPENARPHLQRPHTVRAGRVIVWSLWDWGSAAFNAVMVTFVFGTYLASDAFGDGGRGTSWIAAGGAIAGMIVALTAPVVGQRADRTGRRRLWLGINTGLVVACMAGCFFVSPEESALLLGVILLSAGNVFFEFAEVQYNAMLVDISTPSTMGRVSGIGWASGYLGGIVLLALVYIGFIAGDTHWFGISADEAMNVRAVAVFAAVWFLIFSLPLLLIGTGSKESTSHEPAPKPSVLQSYKDLIALLVSMWHQDRNTLMFLIASAVFRDGVGAIFAYGAILGTTVYGVDPADVLLFGIAANVLAAAGAFAGGFFDDRFGPKLVIWTSLIGLIIAATILLFSFGTLAFWILGLILCLFVGPVQSASRAFLGRLVNPERAGEIYGLYATTGRTVSFLSPALIALFVGLFHHDRAIIPAIMIVLALGAVLLIPVTDPQAEHHTESAEE